MKYKKTYSRQGLLEWVGMIHVGDITMSIRFSGGCQTAYGVNPAIYTTDNESIQKFIEMSKEFKNGTIRLFRSSIIDASENNNTINKETNVQERETVELPELPVSIKQVEVADKSEAIEYLKENYSTEYTATKLRTDKAFEAACKECGVKFVFAE